jgi:[amino group carrier protein]-lysine/ornithine hydrolase
MNRREAVELIQGLVAIRSLSRSEHEATEWLVDRMKQAGFDRASIDGAGNAVGEMGAEDAAHTIVLLGHIDTVPGDIPVRIERTADGDVLYGRGSVDAKGPLATMVVAAARLGSSWAHHAGIRVVVVGAVEEEAATSKGARFIASRFDGVRDSIPDACVIGEPSHWHRITLGYKGRLLLDLTARQPMAHTAGPAVSVAEIVVDFWNWVTSRGVAFNDGRTKPFDQVSPSLRRFVTATTADMHDTVDAQIAWRLPLGFDVDAFARELLSWAAAHIGASIDEAASLSAVAFANAEAASTVGGDVNAVKVTGPRTTMTFRFHGHESAWRGDRQNDLVRSFLTAIRETDGAVQPSFVMKTGTSDMNVVGPIWRCPIVAYGPGDSTLDHTPHEHLSLGEYWRAIEVLERTLVVYDASTRQRPKRRGKGAESVARSEPSDALASNQTVGGSPHER